MPDFHSIAPETPTEAGIAAAHEAVLARFENAVTPAARTDAILEFDRVGRHFQTWHALVQLRFHQDTRNEAYKRARDYGDELLPKVTNHEVRFKKRVLASPHRAEIAAAIGAHALDLWATDILTFDPAIEADLAHELKLQAQYVELHAAARLPFRGETLTLATIIKHTTSADRATRQEADTARWAWFQDHAAELDALYGELVRLRDAMAKKLGYPNAIPLGYKRMKRTDYTEADVAAFRAQVREHVVPTAVKLRAAQAARLGVDPLMYWDEGVQDLAGNPKPRGDEAWMTAQAQAMFDGMGHGLGEFFRMMASNGYLDLPARDGKAAGGFCTSFPDYGVPFIFANFNGTKGDVEVFTHEAGHAFQNWQSRGVKIMDYMWPSSESAEIHSMSLEFLTWPHMDKFFGEDAARFRRIHLTEDLLFIPYGAAVDHFQHLVYAEPQANPARRKAMWQEMERTYLPWRNYGGVPFAAGGGIWQNQRHIYLAPFYYIDYTLALTCALQFWSWSRRAPGEALSAYTKLCARGGEAPFRELVKSAGLKAPFEPGCVGEIMREASAYLAAI